MATHDVTIKIGAKDNASSVFGNVKTSAEASFGSKGLGAIAKAATLAIKGIATAAAGITAGISASVVQAASFQQAMANVKAVSKATDEQFAALKATAQDMASTTKYTADEAAAALQFLAQAGLGAEDMISSLPDTITLAMAGNTSLQEAADITTNIISGMGLEMESLGLVVDKIATAASNSNTNVRQLGEAFAYAGPQAAAVGQPFDEVASALGILGNAGIQAGSAGTALNAALREMIKPSEEAAEKAEELGVAFFDAEGDVRPLSDIIKQLEERSVSARDVLTLFGEEGGRAINALLLQGSPALDSLREKINSAEGAADEMARTMTDTLVGAKDSAKSAFESLMITIGDEFLPQIKDMLQLHITPAIGKFNTWLQKIGGVKEAFSDAIGFVTGFTKGALNALDAFATDKTFRNKMTAAIGNIFKGGVNAAIAFADGAKLILFDFAAICWEPMRIAAELLWDTLKQYAVDGLNAMGEKVTNGVNSIITSFNSIGSAVGLTIDTIDFTPITTTAPKTFADSWNESKGRVNAHLYNISRSASTYGGRIEDSLGGAADGVSDAFGLIVDQAGPELEELQTKWSAAWEGMAADADLEIKGVAGRYADNLTNPIVAESGSAGTRAGTTMALNAGNALTTNKSLVTISARTVGQEAGSTGGIWFLTNWTKAITDPNSGVNWQLSRAFKGLVNGKSIGDIVAEQGADIGSKLGAAVAGPLGAAVGAELGRMAGNTLSSLVTGVGEAFGILNQRPAWVQEAIDIHDANVQAGRVIIDSSGQTGMYGSQTSGAAAAAAQVVMREQDIAQWVYDLRNGWKDWRDLGNSNIEIGTARLIAMDAGLDDWQTQQVVSMLNRAATGFSGVVRKPTMFLAGERGPERVDIGATGANYQGSAGGNVYMTLNVQAWDSKDMERFVRDQLGPLVVRFTQGYSRRGGAVADETGIRRVEAA